MFSSKEGIQRKSKMSKKTEKLMKMFSKTMWKK